VERFSTTMAEPHIAFGEVLRRHRRVRAIERRLTSSARRTALPVLRGNGRGLRVRFGASALMRVVASIESDVEDAFLSLLRPGDVVYDVGANIGWYGLLAARRVGPAGRVIAFEPSVENAAHVQRNAHINGLGNVAVICAALTDRDGWMTFMQRGSLEGRIEKDDCEAQAERRAKRTVEVEGRTPVPITKLDTWLAQTGEPAPNVVKIDVEGAEVGVLRGMTQTLRSAKPTLVIELHGTRVEVADLLDSVDYEHTVIESNVPTRQAPWWAHVLAHPKDGANAGDYYCSPGG
jgi:FkbM family methyltransferase